MAAEAERPGERIHTMPNPKRDILRSALHPAGARCFEEPLPSEFPNCHEKKMPHRACSKCATTRRDVLQVEKPANSLPTMLA